MGSNGLILGYDELWLVEGNSAIGIVHPLVRVKTITQGHSRSNELEMRGHARKVSMVDNSGQSVILQIEETTHDMINMQVRPERHLALSGR